jgi:hypothetical protein
LRVDDWCDATWLANSGLRNHHSPVEADVKRREQQLVCRPLPLQVASQLAPHGLAGVLPLQVVVRPQPLPVPVYPSRHGRACHAIGGGGGGEGFMLHIPVQHIRMTARSRQAWEQAARRVDDDCAAGWPLALFMTSP